jgi:hypothetical protein
MHGEFLPPSALRPRDPMTVKAAIDVGGVATFRALATHFLQQPLK